MITFKKLTIQNFLSFGHMPTEIKLDTDDNTLIIGNNKDVGAEGYSRNGVGKSSIFQALTWVLFNEGISNIKQDAFVNIVNKKKMVVELTMEVDDIEFVIRRGRKPAVCEVLKDGEPYTMHSAATVDDTIETLLGINFDTFCNAILLNTTTIPFMGMKPSPQRDFMEKMVGLDILSERANILKSRNKDIIIEIKLEEQNKVNVVNNYDRTTVRIDSLDNQSKTWETSHTSEIENIETEVEGLSLIDTEQTLKDNQEIRTQKEEIEKVKVLMVTAEQKKDTYIAEANTTYTKLKNDATNEISKSVSECESAHNLEVSELKSTYQTERSTHESESATKSIDLVTEKSELEKSLIEKKALLKETNSYLVGTCKQLKSFVDTESELNEEWNRLDAGICPYCKQKHTDEKRITEIKSELHSIDKDANEIGEDNERVMDGVKDLEIEITGVESSLTELTKQTDSIHSELNKKLVKSQSTQADASEKLTDKFESDLKVFDISLTDILKDLNEEYDSALVDIGMETQENNKSYAEQLLLLEDELKDEVYSDVECAEIISTLKQQKINLEKLSKKMNPYTEQLTQSKSELVEYDESVLNVLHDKESHYKLLIKMLTDNKSFVRKNLLSQYLPFINSKIGEYTAKLELPHIIHINDDLSVDIEYMQSQVSYGNLSNGEKNRCNFAVSVAFRDLLHVSGHEFNFLGIDEILDNGLDGSGFYSVNSILNNMKNTSVFLISHRDELIKDVDRTMTVVKENGFTKIE